MVLVFYKGGGGVDSRQLLMNEDEETWQERGGEVYIVVAEVTGVVASVSLSSAAAHIVIQGAKCSHVIFCWTTQGFILL